MGREATQFKKGDVSNPRGRPPMPKDVKEAIQRAGRVAAQRMEELLEAERFAGLDQKVQVRLIEVALQRAYGKPSVEEPRHLEVSGNVDHGHAFSIKEILLRAGDFPEFRNARPARQDVDDAEEVSDGEGRVEGPERR